MDYKALCQASVEIAVEAGDFIFSRLNSISPREVETKGRHNFVTEVDKEAEILIIGKLKTLVEGAGFIAEEGTSSLRGEKYNWVIDPLDGTTNFIHGAPPVAVSIALVENDIPVTGVVYEIWMKEALPKSRRAMILPAMEKVSRFSSRACASMSPKRRRASDAVMLT